MQSGQLQLEAVELQPGSLEATLTHGSCGPSPRSPSPQNLRMAAVLALYGNRCWSKT